MDILEIALLQSFVFVARTGSVSSAARQVGRTQSAVSMQMRRLDAIVGQPVLRRTGSGVELTAAGYRLLHHAEQILSAHDGALSALQANELSGLISFGCPEDYLMAFFPDLLKGFSELHNAIEIEVVCAPTTDLQTLLQRRRVDVAVISLAGEADPDRIIRPESFVWVGNQPAPPILDKQVIPLALSAPNTLDHQAARTAMEQAGQPYRVAFASNSLAGLLAVTRSGQAISVITRAALPSDLHVLEAPLPPLPNIGISLSYASPNPSPIVKAFGDFVKTNLGQTPPYIA